MPVPPLAGLFALILLVCPRPAPAGHDPGELADLVDQGRFEEAYQLAQQHLDEHAGEPRFDFHYGMTAIEAGDLDEGIFALERVLIRAPGFDRARLELARGLFLQGDDRRARKEFRIVLSHDPPQAVINRINSYLAAMDRRADRFRTTVTGWIQAGAGHDDNVNRAPDTDTVDLAFGTLLLGQSQQDRDTEFVSASGGAQLSRPLVPGLNLIVGADARARSNDNESRFDTRFARGRAGLRYTSGPHTIKGFFEGHRFYVGGDPHQGAGGLNGEYSYELNQNTAFHATARVMQVEYDTQEIRDARLTTIGGGISHRWPVRFNPTTRLTVTLGEEDPDSDSVGARALASRDIRGVSAWLGLRPARDWSLQGRLRFRTSEYETNVFPFTEARDEDYYALDVSLNWHPELHWRVGPYIEYSENDANIELYDYERAVIGARARYSFY